MKAILIILNVLMLSVAVSGLINSNFHYEPAIVIITLITTLLGLLFVNKKSKSIRIIGKKNMTNQKSENSSIEIKGDENQTFQ